MRRRNCPICNKPAISLWQLAWIGGVRHAECEHCGERISVSALSFLLLVSVGTWLPLAGGLLGAYLVSTAFGGGALVGGVSGLVATALGFGIFYFHRAQLVRA
jgi:hypothetical protein